ncbi:AbrB/MazE/SpoVT family DNA-binding domain-containing protein [Bifidobacterium callitrichos]|uniref:AbrB/MazE/SpoVT family DNA-binding domain-containing protein n=2 Tax=Bifidobacterium callitrichos TaxID=762209 RepID=A0A5M9ZE04_9BIFI|nr:AbrB/MazE/SpoVT family DNA-binding domain-containing protein [Bifidobacterium callitrichos]KAA8817370.1 AbrB/MazE/SpoVT family DNA-binding domain-containing protein [Bifidobacterium callitrichos]KFI52808.1 PemI-like protein [Bifidobacterium callitrichos DSM 23973]
MLATATVTKWGNSEGIRIPREVRELAGIHEGSSVTMEVKDGAIVIRPVSTPTRRMGRYVLPDLDALFSDYQGPQPTEDGFANPAGQEEL